MPAVRLHNEVRSRPQNPERRQTIDAAEGAGDVVGVFEAANRFLLPVGDGWRQVCRSISVCQWSVRCARRSSIWMSSRAVSSPGTGHTATPSIRITSLRVVWHPRAVWPRRSKTRRWEGVVIGTATRLMARHSDRPPRSPRRGYAQTGPFPENRTRAFTPTTPAPHPTGKTREYFTCPNAKLDSIEPTPSSWVRRSLRNAS